MLAVNNSRIMHGRESFQGTRNMLGAYVDLDEVQSTARTMGIQVPIIY